MKMSNTIIIWSQALDNKSQDSIYLNGDDVIDTTKRQKLVTKISMVTANGKNIKGNDYDVYILDNDFVIVLNSKDRDVKGRLSPITIFSSSKDGVKEDVKKHISEFSRKYDREYSIDDVTISIERIFAHYKKKQILKNLYVLFAILTLIILIYLYSNPSNNMVENKEINHKKTQNQEKVKK